MNFFDILNGSTYSYLVKYLWVRVEVYDAVAAYFEEKGRLLKMELI